MKKMQVGLLCAAAAVTALYGCGQEEVHGAIGPGGGTQVAGAAIMVPDNIVTKRVLIERELVEDEYDADSEKSAVHSYWRWSWKDWSWVLGKRKYAVTFYYDQQLVDESRAAARSLPLVIFSAGGGANVADYATLVSKIASRGYVVAAMEHAYIDFAVAVDGRWLSGLGTVLKMKVAEAKYLGELEALNEGNDSDSLIYPEEYPTFINAVLEYEAQDVKRFLDLMEQEESREEVAGDLKDVVDVERIVYAGHSLGGMTATLMTFDAAAGAEQNEYYDERVKAGISVDGSAFNHYKFTRAPYTLSAPYLFLGSDQNWSGGNLTPSKIPGGLVMGGVMELAGIEDAGHRYVVEVLGSNHASFLAHDFLFRADPGATDVVAKYVDLFVRDVLQHEDSLSWELFYDDECNNWPPTVSLKYNNKRPTWWHNELNLCAPGDDLPIPGTATNAEEYAVVESRVMGLYDRLVDDLPHASTPNGQSENLAQVRNQIVLELTEMGFTPELEEDTGGTNFLKTFVADNGQEWTRYEGGVNILLDIAGTVPSLPPLYLTAHYDTAPDTPGANDPMSGVVAILEILARLRQDVDFDAKAFKTFERTLRVRIWDQEEVGLIGSSYYVENRPHLDASNVYGVLNLETIGNFSSTPNSQDFPEQMAFLFQEEAEDLKTRHQGRADFIMAMGNPGSEHLIEAMKSVLPQRERMVALRIGDEPKVYSIPLGIPGLSLPFKLDNPFYNLLFDINDLLVEWNQRHGTNIDIGLTQPLRSDHAPFWLRGLTRETRGIPALFITDTANFRHDDDYHKPCDTVENISMNHYLSLLNRVEQAVRKLVAH